MILESEDEILYPPVPCDQHSEPETQPPQCPQWDLPSVSKDDALKALRTFVSEQGLYRKPAEEAVITNTEIFHTFRYRLETFTERRFTKWTVKPYKGETIDNSDQVAPQPWDITVDEPVYFQVGQRDIPVPHTSFVKDCSRCFSLGKVNCSSCMTAGYNNCLHCGGIGRIYTFEYTRMCIMCSGLGRKICRNCNGIGQYKCNVCLGLKKTIVSITLSVKWTNNQDEQTCEEGAADVPYMQHMPGRVLQTESGRMVYPVTHFPEQTVVQTSERVVKEHREKFGQTSQILQQRQTIELIALTKVSYEWRGEFYVFFITDGGVFAENYPEACCGCCSVM